jgi:hypothetical protein
VQGTPKCLVDTGFKFLVANESKPQARKYGREYKLAQEHTTLERFGPRKCNTIHPLCCIVLSFSELQLVKRVSQCLCVRLLSLLDLSKGGDLYPFLDQGQWVTHGVQNVPSKQVGFYRVM